MNRRVFLKSLAAGATAAGFLPVAAFADDNDENRGPQSYGPAWDGVDEGPAQRGAKPKTNPDGSASNTGNKRSDRRDDKKSGKFGGRIQAKGGSGGGSGNIRIGTGRGSIGIGGSFGGGRGKGRH